MLNVGVGNLKFRLAQRRLFLMPMRALLISGSDLEDRFFPKGFAKQLQADWQLRGRGKSARNANTANTRQVSRYRENICEIHLQRIISFLANFEGGTGTNRSE